MRHIVIAVIGTPILTALLLGVVLTWSDGAPALGSAARLVVATDTSMPTDTPTDTPTPANTPAPTPTSTYAPPTWVPTALIIQGMWITLQTGGSCAFTSTNEGVEVTVKNTGATAAGPFVVDVNGGQQSVPDLGAGQTLTLWFSGYLYSGSQTATIYINSQVAYLLTQFLPVPTLPPTCTPTATYTPTDTPTATGTPTPTSTYAPPTWVPTALIIQSMWITLQTGGSCAFTSTTLGVEVTVKNTGATAAGPFVVDVNGSQQSVPDLGAGQTLTLWFSGYRYSGSQTATIYINNQVARQLTQFVPVPTLPPTCTPTATYTPTLTPTPTYTPTPTRGTPNVVAGGVCRGPYDPNFCEYLYAIPTVTLQPLGWQMATDYHGHFQFDGVPDGQYTLVLSPSCLPNAVGGTSCYAPLDVGVSGGGVYLTWRPCPDSDCDGVSDLTDNCPNVYNPDQLNTDAANTAVFRAGADTLGDACDPDISGDGYGNVAKVALGKNTLVYCPIMRADVDGDGVVTILDLSRDAQKFGQTFAPTDPAAGIDTGVQRLNQDADNVISILDLTKQANVFGKPVTLCP